MTEDYKEKVSKRYIFKFRFVRYIKLRFKLSSSSLVNQYTTYYITGIVIYFATPYCVVLWLTISGGTYGSNRFLRSSSHSNSIYSQIFLPEICWEEVAQEIFSYFRFDVWFRGFEQANTLSTRLWPLQGFFKIGILFSISIQMLVHSSMTKDCKGKVSERCIFKFHFVRDVKAEF